MLEPVLREHARLASRRQFLQASGMGLGAAVLGSLFPGSVARASVAAAPKAKRVIFLFMAGAPSQLDLFDPKPGLAERFGEPLPPSVSRGQRVTAMTRGHEQKVVPSAFGFAPSKASGIQWSELLPHLSAVSDRICLVKSLRTTAINHDPGKTFLCTVSFRQACVKPILPPRSVPLPRSPRPEKHLCERRAIQRTTTTWQM